MKLTLLRHGDTAGSRDDLYYGAADIPVLPDSLEMLAERAKTGVYPTLSAHRAGEDPHERPSADGADHPRTVRRRTPYPAAGSAGDGLRRF